MIDPKKLEFFTNDPIAFKHFQPLPASKVLPDWYQDLPRYMNNAAKTDAKILYANENVVPQTIKGCIPVQDYLTSGYVIRAAADILITPETFGEYAGWSATSRDYKCETHSHQQCPVHIQGKKNQYIKLLNAWSVKTPNGYSCYFYQPELFFNPNIKLLPAIVDTDAFSDPVHFPGVVIAKSGFVIHAGDPLMIAFPFKRQDWKHTVALRDHVPSLSRRLFERGYQMFFHKQKKYR